MSKIYTYLQNYPLLVAKIKSLVEEDYLFKNLPTEELIELARRFYLECDTDTMLEIHHDFTINSAVATILCSTHSHQAEIGAWALQHSITDYILSHYKHVFRDIFEELKETYTHHLYADMNKDLSYCANL